MVSSGGIEPFGVSRPSADVRHRLCPASPRRLASRTSSGAPEECPASQSDGLRARGPNGCGRDACWRRGQPRDERGVHRSSYALSTPPPSNNSGFLRMHSWRRSPSAAAPVALAGLPARARILGAARARLLDESVTSVSLTEVLAKEERSGIVERKRSLILDDQGWPDLSSLRRPRQRHLRRCGLLDLRPGGRWTPVGEVTPAEGNH